MDERVVRRPPPGEDSGTENLPSLDDLVARIPEATRTLLDELFRAKFVSVKRLPHDAFKS